MSVPVPADKTRLRWLCRRGMKELDVLFERYLHIHYDRAPPAERAAFARLLKREDPELWSWVLGQTPAPPEFGDVLERLRRHA
jgi:antitoxin CptB